jgi:hypothetical protein
MYPANYIGTSQTPPSYLQLYSRCLIHLHPGIELHFGLTSEGGGEGARGKSQKCPPLVIARYGERYAHYIPCVPWCIASATDGLDIRSIEHA